MEARDARVEVGQHRCGQRAGVRHVRVVEERLAAGAMQQSSSSMKWSASAFTIDPTSSGPLANGTGVCTTWLMIAAPCGWALIAATAGTDHVHG
jgi:hypothetical protein